MIEEDTTIQLATYKDALEIALLSKTEIEYGLGWRWTEEKVKGRIRDKTTNVVVAREGGILVGFGIMQYRNDNANLDLMAVKLEYRRKGVGTKIVKWLEEVAKTAGTFKVYVQTRDQNQEAQIFYSSLGYRLLDKVPGYYQQKEDGFVFFRDLTFDKYDK